MKPQVYGAVREKPNPKMTYALAHSARCKLHLSANRPDRNLRMVLGHAFALDNMLVRIVEIENQSAKDEVDLSKSNDKPAAADSEIAAQDKAKAGVGGGAGVTVAETGSLARSEQPQKERRISFGNSANFRPSDYHANGTSNSGERKKSPPPAKRIPKGYSDEESTSSDDYDDDADAAEVMAPAEAVARQSAVRNNAKLEDVPPQDPYEDEDEDAGLGLQRFQSASARQPRRAPSPPAEEVPALEEDWSDDDIEDRAEPPSPPALGEDLLRQAMEKGSKDEELGDLYETLRGCPCCKQHSSAPKPTGVWRVESSEDGKQYAVLAEERDDLEAGQQVEVAA
jgi:hypothetical protein